MLAEIYPSVVIIDGALSSHTVLPRKNLKPVEVRGQRTIRVKLIVDNDLVKMVCFETEPLHYCLRCTLILSLVIGADCLRHASAPSRIGDKMSLGSIESCSNGRLHSAYDTAASQGSER